MSDYKTEDHFEKKKRKKGDVSFSENASEHIIKLEGSGKINKKKNKHRSTDDRTFMDVSSLDNPSPSYSHRSFIKYEKDTSEKELSNQDCNSSTQKSPNKSKKKKQVMFVEETLEKAGSEEAPHGDSVRKKRPIPKETISLEEDVLEEISQTPKKSKKKKQKEGSMEGTVEETDSKEVLLSDSVRKKKKRPIPPEIVNLEEEDLEDIPQTAKKSKKKKSVSLEEADSKEALLSESVRKKKTRPRLSETRRLEEDVLEDIPQTPKKSKKKKQKEVSVEGTLGEANSEDPFLSESVKKKRPVPPEARSLEEEVLEDIQQTPKSKKKKQKEVSVEKTLKEADSEEALLSGSVGKKKKRPVPPETRSLEKNVLEDIPQTPKKSKKKKQKKVSLEETLGETDQIGQPSFYNGHGHSSDVAVSQEALFGESVRKKKKKHVPPEARSLEKDQDVTADLDISDQDQMETTLDGETSEPKQKKSNRPRNRKMTNDIISSVRERDIALLEEYFPSIRSTNTKTVQDLISYELQRIKDAHQKGFKFETGRFESTEDELIKKNVEKFINLIGLKSGEMLFHSYRFPKEKRSIEQLKKKFHFRLRIAQGLARTVAQVYCRGLTLYDLSGKKGRFSKEEVEMLQKEKSNHGNNWTTIANSIGRNNKTSQLKASQLRREFTGGKWREDEINRLLQAVKEFILQPPKSKDISNSQPQTVPKDKLFNGIPWAKIEEKVKTRNWTHCKSKWNDFLLLRMNGGISPFDGVLGFQTNIDIINWLYKANLPKGQVKWSEMAKDIGNIPPGILQQKVYKLKTRYIPKWRSMSFKEIVNCLYTEVLPKLEAKLTAAMYSQDQEDMPEKQDEFLISDIFEEFAEYVLPSKETRNNDSSSSDSEGEVQM